MISQINEEIEKSIKENIYKLEFKKLKSGKEEKRISYKRECKILKLRHFKKMTYEQISKKYGITISRAREIENRAIEIIDGRKSGEEMSSEEWNCLLEKFNSKFNK